MLSVGVVLRVRYIVEKKNNKDFCLTLSLCLGGDNKFNFRKYYLLKGVKFVENIEYSEDDWKR